MANRSCTSCRDLQENAAEFVMNGVTKTVDTSLRNNTGFNPGSGNDDCTDLNDANDCLIGNREDEVEGYKVCDWKKFMSDFIHSLWAVNKSIISAICGLWTRVSKQTCINEYLLAGKEFDIGEEPTDGSYIVAGKGVSFLEEVGDDGPIRDIHLLYIGGALLRLNGSIWIHHGDDAAMAGFNDGGFCYNFDDDGNGSNYSKVRLCNGAFYGTNYYNAPGQLLYEIRIKKENFPFIKSMYSGTAAPTGAGAYQVNLGVYTAGDECAGQEPSSPKHTVPNGWIYIQARMVNVMHAFPDGQKYTPRGFMGIRLNTDNIDCSGSPEPEPTPPTPSTKHTVTVSAQAGGTAIGSGTYNEGDTVTLVATASGGYHFTGWTVSGSSVGTANPYIFTITSSMPSTITVVAGFESDTPTPTPTSYTITTYSVTDGVQGATGGTTSGGGSYTSGSTATVTATPETGYKFSHWAESVGGSPVSAIATYSFPVSGDRTLYGHFVEDSSTEHTLYITSQTGGSATGAGTYSDGDTATLTATANAGYNFTGWAINGTQAGTNNPLHVNITSSMPPIINVLATFQADTPVQTYTVTTNTGTSTHGTTTGDGTYVAGDSVTVTAYVDAGYVFDGWHKNGSLVSSSNPYTFTMPSENITLVASIIPEQTHNVYLTASPSAGGSASGGGSFTTGDSVTVTATAASGYSFAAWWKGGSIVSTSSSYTFTMPSEDVALTATFLVPVTTYYVTTTASPTGSGTCSGAGSYSAGDSVTVTATAASGYGFNGWWKNGSIVSSNSTYTFTMPVGDVALTAAFLVVPTTYTVSTPVVTNGAVNPTGGATLGGGTHTSGSTATLTFTPNEGYTFEGFYDGVSYGANLLSSNSTYSFTVTGDVTVAARCYTTPVTTYTVTIASVTGGSATGAGTYNDSDRVTLVASASTGYIFDGWTVNGVDKGSNNPYSFYIHENKSVTPRFSQAVQTYTMTANANGGTIATTSGWSPSGSTSTKSKSVSTGTSSYECGTWPVPTKSGSTFVGWYDAATGGNKFAGSDGEIGGYTSAVEYYFDPGDGSWCGTSDLTLYAHWS